MRIIFMGTPDFAVPALDALVHSNHDIVAVYSQPPRPAGRGLRVIPSPVQLKAELHGIPVFTPTSLKSAEAQAAFRAHEADLAVVAAYGLLLPQAILDAPRLGCINIHPSDLPRWRGAAPIQRSIMANDHHTACCIMQMDAGLDTGPVLARTKFVIPITMDAGELHDILSQRGATLMLEVIEQLGNGTARPVAQPSEGVTYAAKITKDDRVIDWTRPAEQILPQIRGLSPKIGAITVINGEIIKVFAGEIAGGDPNQAPGIALDGALLINCGYGSGLRITELQRPNKSRQTAAQCLLGFAVAPGTYARNPIP